MMSVVAIKPALVEHYGTNLVGKLGHHPHGVKGFQLIGLDVIFEDNCRPKLLAAWNVSRLRVHNVTLRNSPMYVISAHSLRNARFTHVTIDSNPGYGYAGAPNTDGYRHIIIRTGILN